MTEEFPSITCPKCKMVSYHEDDIKHQYCGNCHEWHEFMRPKEEIHADARKALDEIVAIINKQPKYCEWEQCRIKFLCEHWHINKHTITFLKPEDKK